MKKVPGISESEWKVMEVAWEDPPVTAQDVLDAVGERENWKLQTIKTLIGRLVKKEALTFSKKGNRYFYSPAVERQDAIAMETENFLSRICRDSVAPLFSHLIESDKRLTEDEIESLKQLLENETNQAPKK